MRETHEPVKGVFMAQNKRVVESGASNPDRHAVYVPSHTYETSRVYKHDDGREGVVYDMWYSDLPEPDSGDESDVDAPHGVSHEAQGMLEETARGDNFARALHVRRRTVLDNGGGVRNSTEIVKHPGRPCNSVPGWFAALDVMYYDALRDLPEAPETRQIHDLLERLDCPDPAPADDPVDARLDPAVVVNQIPALVATLGSLHLFARVLASGDFEVAPDGSDRGTYTVTVKCNQRFKPERAEAVLDHFRQLVLSAYTQADPNQFSAMAEIMLQLGVTRDDAAEARLHALARSRQGIEVLLARLASVNPSDAPHELQPLWHERSDVTDAAELLQLRIAQMAGEFEAATRQDIGATWLYRRALARIVDRTSALAGQYHSIMSDFPLGRYGVQIDHTQKQIDAMIEQAVANSETARSIAVHRVDELSTEVQRLKSEADRAKETHRREIRDFQARAASHEAATAAAILERDAARREIDVLRVSLQMREETIARMTQDPAASVLREEVEKLRRVNASLAGDHRARLVAHEQLVASERDAVARANRLDADLKAALSRARGLSQQLQTTAKALEEAEQRYTRLYAAAYPEQPKPSSGTVTDTDGSGTAADPDGISGRFAMLEID